jgi:hypothetical protein
MRYDVVLVPFPFDDLTGSKVRSALRLHRMVTVSATIIRRQLGVLTPHLAGQVQARLRSLFGL